MVIQGIAIGYGLLMLAWYSTWCLSDLENVCNMVKNLMLRSFLGLDNSLVFTCLQCINKRKFLNNTIDQFFVIKGDDRLLKSSVFRQTLTSGPRVFLFPEVSFSKTDMPNVLYTNEQRSLILQCHITGNSLDWICDLNFVQFLPRARVPCKRKISKIFVDFLNKANASKDPTSRPPLQYPTQLLSEEGKMEVCALAELKALQNESVSLRIMAHKANICRKSARKILIENRYNPYKKQEHQQLVQDEALITLNLAWLRNFELTLNC